MRRAIENATKGSKSVFQTESDGEGAACPRVRSVVAPSGFGTMIAEREWRVNRSPSVESGVAGHVAQPVGGERADPGIDPVRHDRPHRWCSAVIAHENAVGQRGHFNFGEKRTFLLCVDSLAGPARRVRQLECRPPSVSPLGEAWRAGTAPGVGLPRERWGSQGDFHRFDHCARINMPPGGKKTVAKMPRLWAALGVDSPASRTPPAPTSGPACASR